MDGPESLFCLVFTVMKGFSLDVNAVYPLCSWSRPEHDSDIYSTAPVYKDVAGFQAKGAERMRQLCFACSPSFQMSFASQIQGLLKSQHRARACFFQRPSLIPVQGAESFL